MNQESVNPIHLSDFYKVDHRRQYPQGTTLVYSNMTARGSRIPGVDHIVFFGLQYFIKEYLINRFNKYFFNAPKEQAINDYRRRLKTSLGHDSIPLDHMEALHDLGYLPIMIKALPEGAIVPMRVPFLTIENTHPNFFWVTNFLETIMSNVLWHPITSATIANEYRYILDRYANLTGNPSFVQWQGHDFSMRGHASLESSMVSGAAHLLSFTGTDTIPAIDFLEAYYSANAEKELIGGSVAATEHSVMCFGGDLGEYDTYHRLITEVYPEGIVSIVSDTWDYWNVLTNVIPLLKKEILGRKGKVVIRPDSGDPEKIICGDENAPVGSPAYKGTAELLWETFGGTVNNKDFKELDEHIGMIYGDSITLDRAEKICEGLYKKGFASTNIVFGIGSYTYQFVTRDTFGFAVKATAGIVNREERQIYKNPKTDSGVKKSARGWIAVIQDQITKDYVMTDGLSAQHGLLKFSDLKPVFQDGKLLQTWSLSDIRNRLRGV